MLLLTIGELLSGWDRALYAVFLTDCPVSEPLQPIWDRARKDYPSCPSVLVTQLCG